MLKFVVGDSVPLSLQLDDGAAGLYPRAIIYLSGGVVPVTTANLVDLGSGRYESSWVATTVGVYTITYVVYSDAGHTTVDASYSRECEVLEVVATSIESDTSLARKMLQNRLELADGSTNNWILYDDDGSTPLLTWDISGKSGEAILIPAATPAKRKPS
jgi:hypothetical protein